MQDSTQFELNQRPLKEALGPEAWGFLANIIQKALQGELHEDYTAKDPLSRVQAMGEKLRDFSPMSRISIELLEHWERAYKDNDYRQALGWITWHIILLNYERVSVPELSGEGGKTLGETRPLFYALSAITSRAVHSEDWDTLLMSVGICEWARMPESRDELLQILYDKVDKEEIYRRLSTIEHQPRMAIERFLVLYLQRALMRAELK